MASQFKHEFHLHGLNKNEGRMVHQTENNAFGTWDFFAGNYEHNFKFLLVFTPMHFQSPQALRDLNISVEFLLSSFDDSELLETDEHSIVEDAKQLGNTSTYEILRRSHRLVEDHEEGQNFSVHIEVDASSLETSAPLGSIGDHLKKVFEEKPYADAKLMTLDGQKIPANKLFLARAPMLEMKIRELGYEGLGRDTLVMGDVKHEVLVEMIRFLYTDRVENMENVAVDLLAAAELYQLVPLTKYCVTYLRSNAVDQSSITIDNFYQGLIISEKQEIEPLKDSILQFILNNRDAVINSQGFQLLKESRSELAIEVLNFCFQDLPAAARNNI